MNWAAIVGKITRTVDQHLVDSNTYLLAENRVPRSRVKGQMRFTEADRITLAMAAKPLERGVLADIATLVTPDSGLKSRTATA